MRNYLRSRWKYFKLCWQHSRKHLLFSLPTLVFVAYSFISSIVPLIQLPVVSLHLPKIPLPWAFVAFVTALLFVGIEGGYRLRAVGELAHANAREEAQQAFEEQAAAIRREMVGYQRELNELKGIRSAPQLFLRLDHPAEAKKIAAWGTTPRVVIVENNSDKDAFNVRVETLCLDPSGRVRAEFTPIARIGARQSAEVEGVVLGLKGAENRPHDFETIYYVGADEDKYWQKNTAGGLTAVEYELGVTYSDYQNANWYRARARFQVDGITTATRITWLGVERLPAAQVAVESKFGGCLSSN